MISVSGWGRGLQVDKYICKKAFQKADCNKTGKVPKILKRERERERDRVKNLMGNDCREAGRQEVLRR